ncbi:unnamed protein product [Choristocarpus tenellus]
MVKQAENVRKLHTLERLGRERRVAELAASALLSEKANMVVECGEEVENEKDEGHPGNGDASGGEGPPPPPEPIPSPSTPSSTLPDLSNSSNPAHLLGLNLSSLLETGGREELKLAVSRLHQLVTVQHDELGAMDKNLAKATENIADLIELVNEKDCQLDAWEATTHTLLHANSPLGYEYNRALTFHTSPRGCQDDNAREMSTPLGIRSSGQRMMKLHPCQADEDGDAVIFNDSTPVRDLRTALHLTLPKSIHEVDIFRDPTTVSEPGVECSVQYQGGIKSADGTTKGRVERPGTCGQAGEENQHGEIKDQGLRLGLGYSNRHSMDNRLNRSVPSLLLEGDYTDGVQMVNEKKLEEQNIDGEGDVAQDGVGVCRESQIEEMVEAEEGSEGVGAGQVTGVGTGEVEETG